VYGKQIRRWRNQEWLAPGLRMAKTGLRSIDKGVARRDGRVPGKGAAQAPSENRFCYGRQQFRLDGKLLL